MDISKIGIQLFTVDGNKFSVEVLDSVQDYLDYMKEIFDFPSIKQLLSGEGGQNKLYITANSLHGGMLICYSQISILFLWRMQEYGLFPDGVHLDYVYG